MRGQRNFLILTLVVVIGWICEGQTFKDNPALEQQPRDIILADGISGHWATIARFNKADKTAKGYDASYTVIFCRFKPIVKKVGENWQITFTSEIAETIP